MTGPLRPAKVDLEASLLEGRFELVPLANGESVAGVGIEKLGAVRTDPDLIGLLFTLI